MLFSYNYPYNDDNLNRHHHSSITLNAIIIPSCCLACSLVIPQVNYSFNSLKYRAYYCLVRLLAMIELNNDLNHYIIKICCYYVIRELNLKYLNLGGDQQSLYDEYLH